MYEVMVIDPPWPKRKGGLRKARPNQGRELDYRTLSIPEIGVLLDREIFPQLEANGAVFLWAVEQYLPEAEKMMAERGFKLHVRLIWNKSNGIAPAFTVRFGHEYLLWFYRSPMMPVAPDARGKFLSVFEEPAREHSRKPDVSYALIDALYPTARKLDVFSREPRPGWDQWGDQTDHFCSVAG